MWLSVVTAKTSDDTSLRGSCHRFSPISSHVGFVVGGVTGTGFFSQYFLSQYLVFPCEYCDTSAAYSFIHFNRRYIILEIDSVVKYIKTPVSRPLISHIVLCL